ncbi:MAG: dihydrodipicolinate synthase family protein [Armatimonadetes bacterium]|nr:dihydrodipicolinate synthase family protein [Armatimonadota bacterium]
MGKGRPWQGVWPAIVTPFKEDGAIDEASFAKLVERFAEWGIHGLVIAGHNGEAWALRHGERALLTRIARGVVGDKMPIAVGLDGTGWKEMIEDGKEVLDAGADGTMVEPPFLVTTATREETMMRFLAILDGTQCPTIIYNNPRRTQIQLTVDVLTELSHHKQVAGFKEATRDLAHLIQLIHNVKERTTVFVGPAPYILPGVLMGARGYISSGPLELLGRQGVELYDYVLNEDLERARPLSYIATAAYPLLFGLGTWPASLKAAMNMLGLPAGIPRPPVLQLTREATETLRKRLEEFGLLKGAPAGAR